MRHFLLMTIVILFSTFLNSNAQVYILNEDFATANDSTPPAGWNNYDSVGVSTDKWHFDNPGNRVVNFPISPKYAIFDSQNYSQQGGHEVSILESKPFDASVAPDILLKFDHYFVGGNNGAGFVDVFNGSTWNNVAQFIDSTANPESKVIDISAFAGGVANCKVRFRWEGDSSYYWAVDNIRVIAPLLYDMSLTAIDSPITQLTAAGMQPVVVNLKNFSFNTITNLTINWKVNNVVQPAFNWTGSLPIDSFQNNINIGSYNFLSRIPYTITVWITSPNGHTDLNTQNDTLTKNVTLYSPLCGVYTVGGTAPDFTNIAGINAALKYGGINCPVVFKFRNGTYSGSLLLDTVQGSSSVNTITFQSEAGDSSQVILLNNDSIFSTSYVTFQQIGLNSCLYVLNSGWINIHNSILSGGFNANPPIGPILIQNNNIGYTISILNGSYSESKITDNTLVFGGPNVNGINVTMSSTTNKITINNNIINLNSPNAVSIGITNTYTGTDVVISNNQIISSNAPSQYAIKLFGEANFVVRLNRISHFANGIYTEASTNTLIVNNIVQATNSGITSFGPNCIIEFNSVSLYGNTSVSYALSTNNSQNQVIVNNIFSNTNLGYSVNCSATTLPSGCVWNYNDYFSYKHKFSFAGSDISTLKNWQLATGQDSASQGVNPFFYSTLNTMPINQARLNDAGVPVAGITTDIDGNTRGALPDMGAVEYTPCTIDAGIDEFANMPDGNIYDSIMPIYVYLQNQGLQPLTSVTIHWSIDNGIQPDFNWTGNLNYKDSVLVQLGSYHFQFQNFTPQILNVWTEHPDSIADCDVNNDYALTEYVTVKQSLCGTYTVGGINPDFQTISQVAIVLNNGGITCPVIFKLRSGTYDGMILRDIIGSSPVNTITFESESGDSSQVTLNGPITLDSTKYINFLSLGVAEAGSGVITASSEAGWITVSHCKLVEGYYVPVFRSFSPSGPITLNCNNIAGGDYMSSGISISIVGGHYSASKITGNIINDYGINVSLDSATSLLTIDSNLVHTSLQNAISITSSIGTQTYIRNNIVTTDNEQGVFLTGPGAMEVTSNKISKTSIGISVNAGALNTRIFNNFIQSTLYGINTNADNCRIVFNSINIIDTITNSSAIKFGPASNQIIKNNIFANNGKGYAVYTSDSVIPSGYSSNYNDFFSSQPNVAYFNAPVHTLGDWQSLTNQDSASQGVNPFFNSPTDLSMNQVILNDRGVSLNGITTDIESTLRGINPDIGAKEYSPCTNDAGINCVFRMPIIPVQPGNQPIRAILQNQGTSNLTSALIRWSVDGVIQAPVFWSGNLGYRDSISVPIGFFNFQFHNSVPDIISVWTELPNGVVDCNHYNDTSKTTILIAQSLCGIYTVGGLNPDFPTINDAALALNYGGITCAVTFKIRDGNYVGNVILDSIQGTSAVNTLTFESESGDSTKVSIHGHLVIIGTSYLTFRSIGFYYTSATAASINILDGSGWISILNSTLSDGSSGNYCVIADHPTGPIIVQNNNMYGGVSFRGGSYSESDIIGNLLRGRTGIEILTSPNSFVVKVDSNVVNNASIGITAQADSGAQVLIRGNDLSHCYGGLESVLINPGVGYIEISANRIHDTQTGINVAASANNVFIYNNFISVFNHGILNYASNIRIVFNNIFCIGSANGFCAIRTNDAVNQIIKNNILVNKFNGYSIYTSATTIPAGCDWDFNDFYAPNGNIGFFGTAKNTLANWQTATGKDPNSKDLDPLYFTPTELRPRNRQLNGVAVTYPGILVDIDGQVRDQTAPDVGADEFTVDLGITDLINPTLDCGQSPENDITINLGQFGDIPFSNIVVAYSVNNGTVYTDTVPGTITNGLVYTFAHQVDMTHYGNYLFKIWLVNNHDDNINNDTLITLRTSRPSPVVSFVHQPQCADANMEFSGTASVPYGYVARLVWDFGDGGTDSIAAPTHRYDSSGVYFVSLYAYNNYGCYSQFSDFVTVDPTPIPKFTVSNVCVNTPVQLTNQSTFSGGSCNYLWDFGNSSTSTDSIPAVTYTSAGQYTITLFASVPNGCTDSVSKIIVVNDVPQINFPAVGPLCSNGGPVYITGATPVGGIYNGNNLINRYFDPTATGPGNFLVSYSCNNIFGCSATVYDTISVISSNNSDITVVGDSEFCYGDSVILQSNIANSYSWSTGETTQFIVVKNAGVYFVTAFNAVGCGIISVPEIIKVHGNGTPTILNDSICFGGDYILPDGTVTANAGSYYTIIQSQFGCDSIIQTNLFVKTPSINSINASICQGTSYGFNGNNYSLQGTYTSTLVNAAGCDSIVTLNLTVNSPSVSTINASICQGGSYDFNGSNYSSQGTYTATLVNAVGCDSIVTLNLSMNQNSVQPTSINSSSNNISVGTAVTLSVVGGSLGTNASWQWYSTSCGGIYIGSGSSIVVSPSVTSTYFVRAEGLCDTTNCSSVLINVINCEPPTGVLSSDTDNVICKGSYITLSVVGGLLSSGANWVWHTGSCCGTIVGYGSSLTVSPMCTTTYYVNAQGGLCTNATCVSTTITVVSNHPNQPGSISGPVNCLCNSQGVNYSIANVPGATSYTWTVPNNVTIVSGQGSNSIIVNFGVGTGCSSSGGSICVKANNSCGSSCNTCINYSLLPQCPCPISGPNHVHINQNGVVYSVTTLSGVSSYTWIVPTGANITAGQGSNSITVNFGCNAGDVKVKANNACGSSGYCTESVVFNCRIDDIVNAENNLFPNPTSSVSTLYFAGIKDEKYVIVLTNKLGQEIYRKEQIGIDGINNAEIELTDFSLGMYFITLRSASNTNIFKLMKN